MLRSARRTAHRGSANRRMIGAWAASLLVVLAACLCFGAYTGYRLSEILRFRDLAKR